MPDTYDQHFNGVEPRHFFRERTMPYDQGPGQAMRESPILAQLDVAAKKLASTYEAVNRLMGRLEPVLRQSAPLAKTQGVDPTPPVRSAVLDRIYNLQNSISELQAQIDDASARLDI